MTFTVRLPAAAKLLLLLVTLWPTVMIFVFATSSDATLESTWFNVLLVTAVIAIPAGPLVNAIHAVRNPDLGEDRAVWIGLVTLLGPVGGVTYWALYLWPSAGIGLSRGSAGPRA